MPHSKQFDDLAFAYILSVKARLSYYKGLGEKSISQLSDSEINYAPSVESNSMSVIVKHISGNMLSRFTDFLTSDGEKEWRNRDAEFEGEIESIEELLKVWNKGWAVVFKTLEELQPKDLLTTVYIRMEAHTVIDALNRQLAHYPYHIGQMIYLAKAIKGSAWESLSIPKGKSNDFNSSMFNKK